MQPVCFLTRDSHNEIKVSCCPRIRAPEIQQIHEQKRVRSLQQIEHEFPGFVSFQYSTIPFVKQTQS